MKQSSTRSKSLKRHCALPEVKKARSISQKKAWEGDIERRKKISKFAFEQGKDVKVVEKRKASFALLPIEKCVICGLNAKKHAMTRHVKKCGSTCLVVWCKEIHYMKGWCVHHFKLSQYAKHHKILPEEMFLIFKKSNGKCEICKKVLTLHGKSKKNTKNTACIDHCHATGKVRGVLCFNCNSAIGHFSDDTKTIEIALDYLKRTK
jgi:hypothetical protein